jgi:hypothetical protein
MLRKRTKWTNKNKTKMKEIGRRERRLRTRGTELLRNVPTIG